MFDDLSEYGTYMYCISHMSLFNSALLLVQRPGLGFAASEAKWHSYGRMVIPGKPPLIIIQPFGPVAFYYEECDTISEDGGKDDEMPRPWMVGKSDLIRSDIPDWEMQGLLRSMLFALKRHGVFYEENQFGMRLGGRAYFVRDAIPVQMEYAKKTLQYKTHYLITINSKSDVASKVTAICHEIGHLLCGHLGVDRELNKNKQVEISVPDRNLDDLSTESKEFEAERACELIMKSLGWKHDSREYLRDYMVHGQEPFYDLGIAVAAADQFLRWLG